MGKHFTVPTLSHCRLCNNSITNPRFRQYCSTECRDGDIEKRRAYFAKHRERYRQLQASYRDKKHEQKKPNTIQCLICKKWYRQVGSHIVQVHKITAKEYRREYGFDVKRGQLPPDYRALKASQCKENGTINNLKIGKKYWFKKGDKTIGRYERSEETMARLKTLNKLRYVSKKNKC